MESRNEQPDHFRSETSIKTPGNIACTGDDKIMADTLPYEITGKEGDIEYRHYPATVLATADSPGNDSGINLLFAYISGNNKIRSKIPMTTPVISSEKIPMTSPVVSDAESMSFVMPAGKSREEVPDPLDNRVRITTVPNGRSRLSGSGDMHLNKTWMKRFHGCRKG